MARTRWGAAPDDWAMFEFGLDLGPDLLPVVSNPEAKVSPLSKLTALGKVPSVYNKQKNVVGIPDWTQKHAKPEETTAWMKQPDYGICVQTRRLRALDVDVEDIDKAAKISDFIAQHMPLAVRYRQNSGKLLVAFFVEGEFTKRTLKVDGGMIEFLASGQQFVAVGTHPSGVRYEWKGLETVPTLTPEEFETLWLVLVKEFGIAAPTVRGVRNRGADRDLHDPFVEQLNILSWSSDGKKAHIECPFRNHHTTDTGESSCSYFPAGTEGYEHGHFKCLHAHCEDRADWEFQDALGLQLCKFDPLTPEVSIPSLKRDRLGQPLAIVINVRDMLAAHETTGWELRRDVFKEEIIVKHNGKPWRPLEDTDYTALRDLLERHGNFKPIGHQMMRDCVHLVAKDRCVDSAQEWLASLPAWDGVPRAERFLPDYLGADDNAYTRSVGLYAWSAMAGRVLRPGVKADMTPVMIGPQGIQKSTGIEAMAPSPDLFVEVSMADSEDDRIRRTKGRLVGEFGEMRGLYSSQLEAVKAYLVRTHDVWVPKYMEQAITYPRRIFYWGTSNHIEIFTDTTGNRRWLPFEVKQVDRARVIAEREQLWAEGAVLFKQHGIMYHNAEKLGLREHEKYMIRDPRTDAIEKWLFSPVGIDGETPLAKGYVTTAEILERALNLSRGNANSGHGKQVCEAMRMLDFSNVRRRVDGRLVYVWEPRWSAEEEEPDNAEDLL